MPYEEPDCPGRGRCHGPLAWCDHCGDVAHVCDARLRGDPCGDHAAPPTRVDAEAELRAAQRDLDAAGLRLARAVEDLRRRRVLDRQLAEAARERLPAEDDVGGLVPEQLVLAASAWSERSPGGGVLHYEVKQFDRARPGGADGG